jgi:hypothetical protein
MYYLNHLDVKQLYHYLNIFINDKEFHGSEYSPLLGYTALDTNIAIIDSNQIPDQYQDQGTEQDQFTYPDPEPDQNNSDNYFQLEDTSYEIENINYHDENKDQEQNQDHAIIIEPLIVDMD